MLSTVLWFSGINYLRKDLFPSVANHINIDFEKLLHILLKSILKLIRLKYITYERRKQRIGIILATKILNMEINNLTDFLIIPIQTLKTHIYFIRKHINCTLKKIPYLKQ